MQIDLRAPRSLRPYARNARKHSKRQIKQLVRSIQRFGFTNPVLVSDDDEIVAGHGRVAAAMHLGMGQIPVVRLSHLSADERRAYVLADNKLALDAEWDQDLLALELKEIVDLGWEVDLTGFSVAEADSILAHAENRRPDARHDKDDQLPEIEPVAVTKSGDLWVLGRHRLLCGDARDAAAFDLLLGSDKVDLIFTDPPYNCKIDGNVCGNGRVKHREFAMASGEMTAAEFTAFLTITLCSSAAFARDGAIAYVFIDWRGFRPLLEAGELAFSELKNVCIWNKGSGAMGSFYRSQHECVFVFKVGSAPHTNNFGLGETGRNRTNVWTYPGISSNTKSRAEELAMHPTVKPVQLVRDAIEDCSRRGEIVLDCFAGSGTTMIAAERCGRSARLIEYDPVYCDRIIRRFHNATGRWATLGEGGPSFEQLAN